MQMNEERAPLLTTVDVVPAKANIALGDGLYTTPQKLSRGVAYAGHIAHHKLCGDGCLTCERGAYRGTFQDNKLTGKGSFRADKTTNRPHRGNDNAELSSAFTSANGTAPSVSLNALSDEALDTTTVTSYEGEWTDGVPHGRGVMQWSNGDSYDGLFDCGHPHGDGIVNTFYFTDGRVYTGAFHRGLRDGRGKLTLPSGDVYEGQFVRGTVTGYGAITYAEGSRVFCGLLEHGRKIKGHLRFADSQRGYDGEWQDDVPHGSGLMVFANGDVYKGNFAAGELNGVGCLCYQHPIGKIYYGQFLRGQPCGRGYLYEPKEVQSGDGRQAGPRAVSVTEGYFQNGQAVPEGETAARDAIIEATRTLRTPEATPPSYAMLLQLRSPPVIAAFTSSFGGYGFTSVPHQAAVNSNNNSHNSAAQLPIPGTTTDTMGVSAVSSNPPPDKLTNLFFARPAQSSAPLPPPSTKQIREVQEQEEEDEEGDVNDADAEDDVEDVEEAEVDNSSQQNNIWSMMPPLTSAQDGSCRGWLEKCSIGRHNLRLISNWKRRYFILALCNDNICLGYYEDEQCHKPIGLMRLNPTDTRIVTRPTTKTHRKAKHPGRDLCVIYHENRKEYKLLLRARDTGDHDRWAAALRSFFIIVDRPSDYPVHALDS